MFVFYGTHCVPCKADPYSLSIGSVRIRFATFATFTTFATFCYMRSKCSKSLSIIISKCIALFFFSYLCIFILLNINVIPRSNQFT